MRVVVQHSDRGRGRPRCGHLVVSGSDGTFVADHPAPGEDPLDFVRDLVRDALGEGRVGDVDWDHCLVVDD